MTKLAWLKNEIKQEGPFLYILRVYYIHYIPRYATLFERLLSFLNEKER